MSPRFFKIEETRIGEISLNDAFGLILNEAYRKALREFHSPKQFNYEQCGIGYIL